MCVVLNAGDATLPLAIAEQGQFTVQVLCNTDQQRDTLRKTIRAAGLYGTVSADTLEPGGLPYADNLLNIVVIEADPGFVAAGLTADELLRVLAPLGVACVGCPPGKEVADWARKLARDLQGKTIEDFELIEQHGRWVRLRKPWPAEIDQWTHYLHGADGNPVAQDDVVGPPARYQWIANPPYQRSHETDSSLSTLVSAQGRLFYIIDEAPISLTGAHDFPDKWALVARDAFNGTFLWRVPIRRWGWREWKETWFTNRPGDFPLNLQKRLVAVGDKVYVTLGYHAPVSQLDANTGELLQTYADTENAHEMLYVGDVLIISQLDGKRARLSAIEPQSGNRLWTSDHGYRGTTVDYLKWTGKSGGVEPADLDPAVNIASDGSIIALTDGSDLVGIDARSGKQLWRTAFPQVPEDSNAGGIRSGGDLWVGTMIVRDGTVVHASPSLLAAFDSASGTLLWSQPKQYIGHLWYEWKDVFVIDGLVWTWSSEMDQAVVERPGKTERPKWPTAVNGYALRTGETKKSIPLGNIFKANHHHRCYRNKATERFILASRRGTEYVDLEGGRHTIDNWVRGTCHVGMMPANGLQYATPHPCQCYIEEKLNGFNALAPAKPAQKADVDVRVEPRLERGTAYGQASGPAASEGDWPAFRHDSERSGAVATAVPAAAALRWSVELGGKVSPPTVVGQRVFVAESDAHHVVCLDAGKGTKLWEFAAGARVDSPPTYHQGALYFGARDGWVYCLRASDGRLAWRFRGAPPQRWIGAFDQLESAWPVHGSVLVQDGLVYFAAGRSSHLDGGIFLWALDAATGAVRHKAHLEGPSFNVNNLEENMHPPTGALNDILAADGDRIFLRSKPFDGQLRPQKGKPDLSVPGGMLEDVYFKRTPWTFGGEYARLLVHDKDQVYYVRMFDTLRGLDPTVYFTPGKQGYMLFAKNMGGKKNSWLERVPVRIRAMVLDSENLWVAGPPDVVDPQDPQGAFENRKGGLLYAVDPRTGKKAREVQLPSPPVFNGAAAAGGGLYLVDESGCVSCFAGRSD
ncbi:MAG: PQQ-binding-like beta-propeller repeat protein [Planctomycetota bacterium]